MAIRRGGRRPIKALAEESEFVERVGKLMQEAGYKLTRQARSSSAIAFDFLATNPDGRTYAVECRAQGLRPSDLGSLVSRGRAVRPSLNAIWIVSDELTESLRQAAKKYPEVETWTWYEIQRHMRWESERRRLADRGERKQGRELVDEISRRFPPGRKVLVEAERVERPSPSTFDMPLWKRPQVFQSLAVLITAFEEVEEYDPRRHHNQPRPALWINDTEYLSDLKALLQELRDLNNILRKLADRDNAPPKAVTKKVDAAVGVFAMGGRKFVENYAGALGTGLGALTVGAIGVALINLGVSPETVSSIFGQLKPGK